MKVCAMVDRSAGNESVGEMWTECAEFDESASVIDILKWAGIVKVSDVDYGFGDGPEPRLVTTTNITRNVRLALLIQPEKSNGD